MAGDSRGVASIVTYDGAINDDGASLSVTKVGMNANSDNTFAAIMQHRCISAIQKVWAAA